MPIVMNFLDQFHREASLLCLPQVSSLCFLRYYHQFV